MTRRILALTTLAALAVVPVACGEDSASSDAPVPRVQGEASVGCGKSGAAKGELGRQSVTIKGNARSYQAVVPRDHDGKTAMPLVFVFHGSGGDGTGIRKSFDLEREAEGKAIFVYPDADPTSGMWDLDRDGVNNHDILMFDAILESISTSHCVDRKRVFAAGFSAGAYFANQLACRRGSDLRAVASHGGGGPFGQNGEYDDDGNLKCPQRPIAALVVHGTGDGEVSLDEGKKSLEHWRRVNACVSGAGAPRDPAPCAALAACAEDRPVVYCEVPGLGHAIWPENGTKITW
ncbi:MAG: phospholipase/Carboxylesterase, partial [Labilithrix sp.]|nr:phospholipase/Carboxylesterase [Labilithrix sp.]